MERTLVEILLKICNSLLQFVLFTRKHLGGAVKLSFLQMLFKSHSCFVGVNLLQLCFSKEPKMLV